MTTNVVTSVAMFWIVTVTLDLNGLNVRAKLCDALMFLVVNIYHAIPPPRILPAKWFLSAFFGPFSPSFVWLFWSYSYSNASYRSVLWARNNNKQVKSKYKIKKQKFGKMELI